MQHIADTNPAADINKHSLWSRVANELRILAIAGISVGVLVGGVGSRLAMFALRLTSPDSVRGVTSDDGFTIGRFTLSGTYSLIALGAVVGIIGAATYQCVAPRLIGPLWFRRVTVGLAAGAVVGSLLIHSDGVDFTVLKPTWFAIALFVLLPALFGAAIGPAVDWVSRTIPAARSWYRWILPIVLALLFPVSLVILAVAACVYTVWTIVRDSVGPDGLVSGRASERAVQACWLAVALFGLVALIGDIRSLY